MPQLMAVASRIAGPAREAGINRLGDSQQIRCMIKDRDAGLIRAERFDRIARSENFAGRATAYEGGYGIRPAERAGVPVQRRSVLVVRACLTQPKSWLGSQVASCGK